MSLQPNGANAVLSEVLAEAPAAGQERLRVLVADPDGFARGMMRVALREHDRVAAIHTVGDGREALQIARYYRPAVTIIDTDLPPAGGLELIRKIRDAAPETNIVTVSVNDHPTALAALRAGAVGHIDKGTEPEELARSVVRAADGEAVVPQGLLELLIERLREVPDTGWRPLHSRLTTREWEIIELLGAGANTEQIADELVLSRTTVYSHVKSVLRKLGVHSRREAVAAAIRLRREEALAQNAPGS